MSVRNVLLRPAAAGHLLARTDRYEVTHVDLNIPKPAWGKLILRRDPRAIMRLPEIDRRALRDDSGRVQLEDRCRAELSARQLSSSRSSASGRSVAILR
jgi:hypothetical protein